MEKTRKALVILSLAVSFYYLLWRAGTLNHNALLFSCVLYGAEIYGFLTSLGFYFMVYRPTFRKSVPAAQGLGVDVFIPTLNEDASLLRKTILGCIRMDYPHRTILLDDGNRPEIQALCEELKCVYLARISHEHAKAGNLNFGLKYSNADFVAIFDADHVPQHDFLTKLLGYFKEEKVALVQTPQDFYNLDSFEHRRTGDNGLWTEESLFYSLIMPGKDHWNAAFLCGSGAVLRRKALDDIGGFATGTVTEDLHTSIRLHSRGWRSVYHRESLAHGIAPQELKPFQSQRLRWGMGAMQIFAKDNPLFKKGLTIPQRINYMASMTTYFDGFQKLVYYFSPAVVLFSGVLPITAYNMAFLVRFVPHLALSMVAYEEMSRGYGKSFLMEQYNMTRFYVFIKSVFSFLRRKKIAFKVTPKSGSPAKASPGLLTPQILVLAGSASAIAWALFFAPYRLAHGFVIANILWAFLNSGIAFLAIKYSLGKVQRRKDFRFPAKIVALVNSENNDTAIAIIEDIHEKGISMNSFARLDPGKKTELTFLFPGKPVSVSGRILNGGPPTADGLRHFYRMAFDEVAADAQNRIIEFSFTYALNKMMGESATVFDTPLERIGQFIERKRTFINRKPRYKIQLAGFYRQKDNGEMAPFVTEDISETGMRLATYSRMAPGAADFEIFLPEDNLPVRGTIMWGRDTGSDSYRVWRYGIRFDEESVKTIAGKADLFGRLSAPPRGGGKGR